MHEKVKLGSNAHCQKKAPKHHQSYSDRTPRGTIWTREHENHNGRSNNRTVLNKSSSVSR
jgi:hypothetical protein